MSIDAGQFVPLYTVRRHALKRLWWLCVLQLPSSFVSPVVPLSVIWLVAV